MGKLTQTFDWAIFLNGYVAVITRGYGKFQVFRLQGQGFAKLARLLRLDGRSHVMGRLYHAGHAATCLVNRYAL